MEQYKNLINEILSTGTQKNSRAGNTTGIIGHMFKHDMKYGFPLLTRKYVPLKLVTVELEGFIKGITSKKWYQDRGCHIWDSWCNRDSMEYLRNKALGLEAFIVNVGRNPETEDMFRIDNEAAKRTDDLGPIYGFQWNNFNGYYESPATKIAGDYPDRLGVSQLNKVIRELRRDKFSRRLLVSAWNPEQLYQMALPPCHYGFQLLTAGDGRLSLIWQQRSVDVMLGLPFNIASYALLLSLIANEVGMIPGILIGQLADVHIYHTHLDGVKTYLDRCKPDDGFEAEFPQPKLKLGVEPGTSIFDWTYDQVSVENYNHLGPIKMPVSV
jgi:thymidylate synthase